MKKLDAIDDLLVVRLFFFHSSLCAPLHANPIFILCSIDFVCECVCVLHLRNFSFLFSSVYRFIHLISFSFFTQAKLCHSLNWRWRMQAYSPYWPYRLNVIMQFVNRWKLAMCAQRRERWWYVWLRGLLPLYSQGNVLNSSFVSNPKCLFIRIHIS